jgi:hypothetical protein
MPERAWSTGLKAFPLTLSVLLLAGAGSSRVVSAQTREDIMPVVVNGGGSVVKGQGRLIVSLNSASGSTVDFIDLLDGHAGVGESASWNQMAILPQAVSFKATPLEIYLAIAPRGSAAPALLYADHAETVARTHRDPAPRDLTTQLAQGGPSHSCLNPATWAADWIDWFSGVTQYRFSDWFHWQPTAPQERWFYPGKHIYDGTNTNDISYLGVCHQMGSAPWPLEVQIHRRKKVVQSGVTSFTWVEIASANLNDGAAYTFYSNLPASYRGYVETLPYTNDYALGVAYTKTGGLATP